MKLLRKLVPAFLWQWDQRLLQDHPRLWATRAHLHLWFLLLCNALAAAVGLLINVGHRKFPDPEELFAYMILPTVAYAAFWVYRVVRFNATKRFGTRKPYDAVGEFIVLWASALLIITIPTTLSLIVGLRIAALTPDEEFVAEVDLLGGQAPWFFGYSQHWSGHEIRYGDYNPELDHELFLQAVEAEVAVNSFKGLRVPQGGGSHLFFRNIREYQMRFDAHERLARAEVPSLHDIYTGYIQRANGARDPEDSVRYNADTAAYFNAKADSIERGFPLLLIDHGQYSPWSEKLPFKRDSVLEAEYLLRLEQGPRGDMPSLQRALGIGLKYSHRVIPIDAEAVAMEYERRESSSANLALCQPQMARIAKAKDLRYFFLREEAYFYFIAIFSFFLALLLSIFKRLYWQPFLIAIVTAAVVPVLVLILALILEHDVIPANDGEIIVHVHWAIAVFLFAMCFTILGLRAYRTNRAVMVILANAVIPFFALFTLMLLQDDFDIFGEDALKHTIMTVTAADQHDIRLPQLNAQLIALREYVQRVTLWTFWGGIALYVLVLHPLFARLYERLMALPERK